MDSSEPLKRRRTRPAAARDTAAPDKSQQLVGEILHGLARIPALQTNTIFCNDNVHRLRMMPDDCVDLIYLDPPFFSNRQYEVIWGDEAEVRSFEDRWEGGIRHYVEWLADRVREMWRILKPTGTLYLHCDWHASHYIRVMLDDTVGSQHFQNEIIWHYRGGGVSSKRFGKRHDTIFYYTKGSTWTFNVDEIRTAYSQESLERLKYKARSFRGDRVYDSYEPNPLGKHPDDVLDIQPVMPSSKERMGYPTQKPERLLEVFVKASSNPGDVVLDPFAGCGTSLVVAQQLGRRWVGIDISPTACNLMKRRLLKVHADEVRLVDMPQSVEDLRNLRPFEFQNWVIDRINGIQSTRKSGDMGIDGWTFLIQDPVQIKQSEHVGRPVIDSFETAIRRAGKVRGVVIAFSFTRGAHEEVARVKPHGLSIRLITVSDLLSRNDWAMRQMGVDEVPRLEVAPMPVIIAARRSASELVDSDQRHAV
jgi:DNA modification methylase